MPNLLDVYVTMPHATLVRELEKKGKRMIEIQQIIEEVQMRRKARRADRMRRQQHDVLWGDVLAPLEAEVNRVKASLRYVSDAYPNREREAALNEYLRVLLKGRNLLKKYWKAYELTPRRLSKEKGVPNDGAHWVDWIPASVKTKVVQGFEDIPKRFRAKVKIPFERTIDEVTNLEKRIALRKRTEKNLATAERELQANPIEDNHEEVKHIKKALRLLDSGAIPDDAPVPLTWHGILKHWG